MPELRVFKYPLDFKGGNSTRVEIPRGFRILKFALQERRETVWALVDPDAPLTEIEVVYYGTGWRLPLEFKNQWTFLDTLFAAGGTVWHYWWRQV
jgi:hypothetical protein